MRWASVGMLIYISGIERMGMKEMHGKAAWEAGMLNHERRKTGRKRNLKTETKTRERSAALGVSPHLNNFPAFQLP